MSDTFEIDDARARKEAELLWRADGSPEGGPERYLEQAAEIIAIKDSSESSREPLADTLDDPAESPLSVDNQADVPGLDDLENNEGAPSWEKAREIADQKPLSHDTKRTS